jgi:uncharacterized protein
MIPIRFGPPARQLFGLYQPPAGTDRGECAVLCNPFGQEAIRCHRLYRILGDRLARAGLHVLRFDYLGSGDSDGDDSAADLDVWTDDVLRANDEAARRSGCARSAWFGLRLGASLAALASARAGREPVRLVLWDPVIDGAAYLAELAAAHVAAGRAGYGARWKIEPRLRTTIEAEAAHEALGFELGAALQRRIGAITPDTIGAARARKVTILARPAAPLGGIEAALASRGVALDVQRVPSEIAWAANEAMNTAIVPADILQAVVAAMTDAR